MSRENLSCSEAQSELEEIKSLKAEFDVAFNDAVKTGNLERAKTLRTDLESRVKNLREGLISPIERKLDLKHRYESQHKVLIAADILDRLPSGEHGIHGIDDKEYPMPSYEEIRNLIREKKEILEKKAEQGFTKLLVVPFGMPLNDLAERYKTLLLKHYVEMPNPNNSSEYIPDPQKTTLFATKENDTDPNEPLELDTNEPLWQWDQYRNADINGTLIYDPKEFSISSGGKTKAELLANKQAKSSPAWRIIMVESDPNIPRETKGKELGGRQQLEAGKTPTDYLALLGKNQYENESGITPEEWLMQAISYLEEKNQVIDDYQGKGSIAYNTGAYFPASGSVPFACWDRDARRAVLGGGAPSVRVDGVGARSAVRV